MYRHSIKSETKYRQALEEKIIDIEKSIQSKKMMSGNKNMITKSYITPSIRIMNKY
jgi:hypothetical protein